MEGGKREGWREGGFNSRKKCFMTIHVHVYIYYSHVHCILHVHAYIQL